MIEERSQMKAQSDSERQALTNQRKALDEEYKSNYEILEKEKQELHEFKNELHKRETQLLLEREEHEKAKLKEQSVIDLQKVTKQSI